jgi:hypothetical protein
VYLRRGRKEFTVLTDANGEFEFIGLPGGTYHVDTSGLPSDAFLLDPGDIEITAHACHSLGLRAGFASTVNGRVTVAPGFAIGPMHIAAMTLGGRQVASTAPADGGRYAFNGLVLGDYLIAVLANPYYLQTYAPGTRDAAQAAIVRVTPEAALRDVDIDVPASSEIITLTIRARAPQGVPLDTCIHVSRDGVQDVAIAQTNRRGEVSVTVAHRGGPIVVTADPVDGNCAAPVTISANDRPQPVDLMFSPERCR